MFVKRITKNNPWLFLYTTKGYLCSSSCLGSIIVPNPHIRIAILSHFALMRTRGVTHPYALTYLQPWSIYTSFTSTWALIMLLSSIPVSNFLRFSLDRRLRAFESYRLVSVLFRHRGGGGRECFLFCRGIKWVAGYFAIGLYLPFFLCLYYSRFLRKNQLAHCT